MPNPEKLNFVQESTYGKWFNDNIVNVDKIIYKNKNLMLINTKNKIYKMTRQPNGDYLRYMLPLQKTKASIFMGLLFENNNIVWIGSNVGLFKYDFKKKKNYEADYYTLISKVTVGAQRVVFRGTNYFFVNDKISNEIRKRSSINQSNDLKIVLDYKDNNIVFEYAAPFFEFPKDIRFSYYLEGMDKKWSDWTDKTLKEYTNIYSGQYCFKVKAKNIFGNESKIASYEFKVLAPWYLTIYAYFAYVVLLIILMIIVIQLHSYRLIKAKRNLEKIVRWRTAEIVKQKDKIAKQKSYLQEQAEQLTETNVELELINKELEKLSIVVSETDNAVLLMDMDGNIEWVNEGFSRMYEDTLEQFVNERGGNIIEISSNENIKSFLEQCKTTFESIKYESLNTTRTGQKIWTYTSLTPILGNDGKVEKIIAIDSDITKIKQAEEKLKEAYIKLEEIANIDALTEIPNRRIFEENVLMEWRRCYRYKMPISLIMIDIDNFKKYNDTYGHQRGDVCLKTLGVILNYSLNRVGDSAARYGGEEFAVILSDTDKNGALKIAESIRTRVESLRIKHDFGVNNIVTISLGVATIIPDAPEDYNKLIKVADMALYESKETGRNRVTFFKR
jgi:diguanylate cyclase (GGDEF)-like protein/PAS domain S-box-containing protein